MPVLLPGVQHDYKEEVLKALPSLLPVAEEEK
eukprot:CAMPEP_0113603966 /NCGR_PEP_ID=MMETSP0017_2-20120614/1550_1 /TAXON_ID=2856 /ORGANISM="Cylindrotheca closterium" /LENGTH=31 /DNA_ID=CAMNT_0000512373 /DNA_START=23 /DNA_END=118 /DNA_ORIENTATION=- /assembly_acc=CAM_ASM_000147